MNKKSTKKNLISYLLIIAFIGGVLFLVNTMNTKVHKLKYSEFVTEMEMVTLKRLQ